jgi:hypothetical protein
LNGEAEAKGQQGEGETPPSQEELRRRIEEQLREVRVQDLLVESVVSVLNLAARRIAKADERDLEQARVGIEAVRAWVELLPDDAAKQVRNALSELQMLYAREARAATEGEGAEGKGQKTVPEAPDRPPPAQGPSKPPPGLWTPPGST